MLGSHGYWNDRKNLISALFAGGRAVDGGELAKLIQQDDDVRAAVGK